GRGGGGGGGGQDRFERLRRLARQLQEESVVRAGRPLPPVRGLRLIVLASVLAVLAGIIGLMVNYNRFVSLDQQVQAAKGRVEASLQRRANLFPNLVMLTGSQAVHETEVFRHVAEVRTELLRSNDLLEGFAAQAAGAGSTGEGLVPELAALPAATIETLKASMGRLMALGEAYPDIKAVTTYHQLMTDLVEIETLILEQRRQLNETTQSYNTAIMTFPSRILARLYGFHPYAYFQAAEEAHINPEATGEMLGRSLLPVPSTPKP
ncbi:MAG: LemA family protein, partial [Thermodesulfobacteriota bacterium]